MVKLAMVQLHADLGKEEYLGRARLVLQVRGGGAGLGYSAGGGQTGRL